MFGLTRTEFQDWLLSKKEDEVVGKRALVCECPITNYLKTQFPGQHIEVEGEFTIIGENQYRTPNWAAHFINGIDFPRLFIKGTVTAKEALEALKCI